jgi:RNA polymerase sigma factor (sigma-70 family)
MEQPTDAELLARSREEPAVFAGIYERYATTIYRYAARRVGPSDAEALMAETFRIAFERRAMYDTTRPVARPWLYGIATNLVARHRRTEARRWRALARLDTGDATTDDSSDRVVDAVAAAKLLPDVVSAMGWLTAADRDALLLHVWEHLAYEDVAAALGIPVGTVRLRINRARTKLRELTAVAGEQLVHADVFTANKERLMTTITGNEQPEVLDHRSRMYPRLAYRDEHAALEYLTRVFGFKERREARVGGRTPDGWDMGYNAGMTSDIETRALWAADPEDHDFDAVRDYLSLQHDPAVAESVVAALRETSTVRLYKAKDILRASGLEPLGRKNFHVDADLAKVKGKKLSPVLLVRDVERHVLVIADGFHRVCASKLLDESSRPALSRHRDTARCIAPARVTVRPRSTIWCRAGAQIVL